MTHVLIDYFNYRVYPQIVTFFLTNLAKSKHSYYVENALYFNTNFRSHNALYLRTEAICVMHIYLYKIFVTKFSACIAN
jgi:hypothetical protein